jgi:geranylgeranyl pyrophosphate synthase
MVLACSYALNAHQAAHSATTSTTSADTCRSHSDEERKCGGDSSAQGATKRCGSGYGRDLRSEAGSSCSSSAEQTQNASVAVESLFATPQQKRLAEITEMIHTASLFHDDVIDKVCFP